MAVAVELYQSSNAYHTLFLCDPVRDSFLLQLYTLDKFEAFRGVGVADATKDRDTS